MMEQRFEVKPIGVKYICDSCEEGEMIYTGEMLFFNPPTFKHTCNNCDSNQNFIEKYPLIRYQEFSG
ncbi:hypothetical protein COK36_20065 [Bacillus cereus]|uniref:hypothetical protein n=2 Tax=Bacillus cereus TaxID=1396 RepID=UPI000BF96BF2|nr:hypothetical protein [Bacillus cereus]PFR59003.1 hypothetical protein COK36_20065 [Bacillus cereus]PGW99790.1 hypothetical protein COE19_01315 [Bacillus cereus]PGY91536.1 hypothetical protein COE38_16910 [Bacillus cereus]